MPLLATDNVPASRTTLPAVPEPDVLVEILLPLPAMTTSRALTFTDPASPLFCAEELELAKMPVCQMVPVFR